MLIIFSFSCVVTLDGFTPNTLFFPSGFVFDLPFFPLRHSPSFSPGSASVFLDAICLIFFSYFLLGTNLFRLRFRLIFFFSLNIPRRMTFCFLAASLFFASYLKLRVYHSFRVFFLFAPQIARRLRRRRLQFPGPVPL